LSKNALENLAIVFVMLFVICLAALIITLIVTDVIFTDKTVEVRLVNAVGEDGEHAWEFLIDDKEIPAGKKIDVYKDFPISVKEFYSREITDNKNIASLIKDGDVITYRYFSPESEGGERIFVEIQHKDGTITWVSLNIY